MIRFGVFDHVDHGGGDIARQYRSRLDLVEALDRGGFYGYHVAEHHGTPLGLASSPSVYLAAVAERTSRLRFGPMVYIAALHHPMRLAEEIAMLDQMSGGRLQLGLGRGAVPVEQKLFDVDPDTIGERFEEARALVLKALTSDEVEHDGPFYRVPPFPMVLRPLQRPHPPLWHGLGSVGSARWAAANAVNCITLRNAAVAADLFDAVREEWSRLGRDPAGLPLLGVNRHVVVAADANEARQIARTAYARWRASFVWLWELRGATPPPAYPDSWEGVEAGGMGIAGDPATVADFLKDQAARTGSSYLSSQLIFGDMAHEDALASIELFAREVMPRING